MSEQSSDVIGSPGPTAEEFEEFASDIGDDPRDYYAHSDESYSLDLESDSETDASDEQAHEAAVWGSPPAYEPVEAAAEPKEQLVAKKAQLTLFQSLEAGGVECVSALDDRERYAEIQREANANRAAYKAANPQHF